MDASRRASSTGWSSEAPRAARTRCETPISRAAARPGTTSCGRS